MAGPLDGQGNTIGNISNIFPTANQLVYVHGNVNIYSFTYIYIYMCDANGQHIYTRMNSCVFVYVIICAYIHVYISAIMCICAELFIVYG